MELVLIVAAAALLAIVSFLRVVAPRTKTLKDDKVLDVLEKGEGPAQDYVDSKTGN